MAEWQEIAARVGTGAGLVLAGWLAGRLVRWVLHRRFERTRTPSFAYVVPRLAGYAVLAGFAVVAATAAFPSIDPVDVVAGAGVFSIAAGFAFQDILSNLLAGLLLIIRQPFVSGDQVLIVEDEGTVERITVRETTLRTYDGERVVIPNADVYQSVIRIRTAFDTRCTTLALGIGYDDDLGLACERARQALTEVPGVAERPGPQVLLTEFGESAVGIEMRYWTPPRMAEVRAVRHGVVEAVTQALDDAGVHIPFPIRTLDLGEDALDALAGGRRPAA